MTLSYKKRQCKIFLGFYSFFLPAYSKIAICIVIKDYMKIDFALQAPEIIDLIQSQVL